MNKRASISANLRADATGWKKGCDTARAETAKLKRDTEATTINGPKLNAMGGIGRSFTEIKAKGQLALGAVEAAWRAVNQPVIANVWYQDLKDSLTSATGSAEAATEVLGNLRLISQEQGMTDDQFEMMVQYSIAIQSAGHSAEEATEFIREMANAAESMGGGIEDMEALLAALDKMDAKNETTLKQLDALTAKHKGMRKIMEAGLGTGNAAELAEMGLGYDELFKGILRGMKSVETATASQAEKRTVNLQGQDKKQSLGADSADDNGTLADRTVGSSISPDEVAALKAAESKRKSAAAELEQRTRINAVIREEEESAERTYALAVAKANQDQAEVNELEDHEEIRKRVKELQKDGLAIDKDQLETIKAQIAARRSEASVLAGNKEGKESDSAAEIAGLRHMGRNRQADRLEDKEKQKKLEADGLDPKAARRIVENERDLAEDEALGPGKRKIRSFRQAEPAVPERKAIAAPPDQIKKQPVAPTQDAVMGVVKAITEMLTRIENNTRTKPNESQKPVSSK